MEVMYNCIFLKNIKNQFTPFHQEMEQLYQVFLIKLPIKLLYGMDLDTDWYFQHVK